MDAFILFIYLLTFIRERHIAAAGVCLTGVKYTVQLSGSYRSYRSIFGRISVILIGDEGNSAELILGDRYDGR